ncbi:MAG: glutamine synthetase family protein [Methanomassiliicoccales archaeon]|nr:glutamine synthetase family protein [Methanomassiliicoccales archaeon]
MTPTKSDHEEKDAVLSAVKKENVKFVEMQFSDILGTVKSVSIPAQRLEKALDEGVFIDGSSILGYATIEESDMRAVPILDSFLTYPWSNDDRMKTARFMCKIFDHNGNRFKGDPRYVLERMMEKAKEKGYVFNVGPEFEFFLFKLDGDNHPIPVPNDVGGYFDLMPLDTGEMVRKDIMMNFDRMNFDVEASHHEVAPGQHEVDLEYNNALTLADRMVTLKYGIKAIASRHGLHATFMPKPLFGVNGSGMHVHQSFSTSEGNNLFDDPSGKYGLSDIALKYIGGLLAHAKETCAILASYVNSYKRLVPGYEAPCYISWANRNRSALIRVPAGRGSKSRVELRNPDPAGNPYLQFAVMLAAGTDGIEHKIEPPEPVEKDIYHMSKDERARLNIESLPESLGNALSIMSGSTLVKDTLGDHIFNHYLHIKTEEWDDYRIHVTDWEVNKFLRVL